jgi:hypothetical protein
MNDNVHPTHTDAERDSYERLPLDAARNEFAVRVTGPKPLAVSGRRFPGLPNRLVPLDELRDRLLDENCPTGTRDAVWAYLIRRSRRDGATWMVACVGMALPGLARTASWLAARYRGDRADIHAAVLSGFIEALAAVDLRDPGVLYRLLWMARRAGQEALEESLDAPMPSQPVFESRAPQTPGGHPDLVLARLVNEGVLTAIEADLISATRIGHESVTGWAHARGESVHATAKARERAEQRLAAYLKDPDHHTHTGADSDDPVADAAVAAIDAATPPPNPTVGLGRSRSVSGRHRNGRPALAKKSSRLVSKRTPESGLLGRGETTPTSPHPDASQPTSEVRRCA